MSLSPIGQVLLPAALDVLHRAEAAITAARRATRGELGTLTVGFTDSAAFDPRVTTTLRRYRERFAGVELTLIEASSAELAERLQRAELQAAFVRPPLPQASGLSLQPLTDERLMRAIPLGHPLAKRRRLAAQDFDGQTLIAFPRATGGGLSQQIVATLTRYGIDVSIGQQAPQLSSTINLVAAGFGLAIVPAAMASLAPAGVCYRPLRGDWPPARLALASRDGDDSPLLQQLQQLAHEVDRQSH